MKINWKQLLLCIAIPLAVGGLSAFLTSDNMRLFEQIQKPPLSPPALLFPIVWTILYVLMGIASYLVLRSNKENQQVGSALKAYGLQLVFNFFWSLIFFNAEAYLFSFIWLVIMWVLIIITIIRFYRISKPAGYLMIPLLIWVTFAGYLNLAIYFLN